MTHTPISTEDVLAGLSKQIVFDLEKQHGNTDLIRALDYARMAGPFKVVSPWELEDPKGYGTIEYAYYRRRDDEDRWGPRTLDLDIILFGNRNLNDSHLVVPHPEFVNRRFVLEPMLEIDGDRFIPGYGSLAFLVGEAPALAMEKLPQSND